jgi:splicing factor 3A subunit 2
MHRMEIEENKNIRETGCETSDTSDCSSEFFSEDDESMLDAEDCSDVFSSQSSIYSSNKKKILQANRKDTPSLFYQQQQAMQDSFVQGGAGAGTYSYFSYNNAPSPGFMVALYHHGRKLSLDTLWEWITWPASGDALATSSSSPPVFPIYLTLCTSARLLGGIDRQNRVGSKFGGGGVSSAQQSERERKERLRQLALESIDLAKDPYLMRNHLGTYECKLCLTLHTNEANYLAHTQGKKHQQGLAKRAHMEKLRAEKLQQQQMREDAGWKKPPGELTAAPQRIRIGRPAYQVFKSRDADTQQRCLSFELQYPQIEANLQPRHRFMSAFEQKIDLPPDRRYQYLLCAADPYQTVAFKIPNEPLDREPGRFVTHWDDEEKIFTLTLYFLDPNVNTDDVADTDHGSGVVTSASGTKFAPAIGTR